MSQGTEEVVEPTEEELYDAEYEKAWDSDEESGEEVEQPEVEIEADADEQAEEEAVEDSIEEEDVPEEPVEEPQEEASEEFAEVLKWKGKEIPVTREELIALGQKGFDSEKKWQEAALNRPIKEIVDKYGFTVEQLEMLGNIVKDKNAEALALLAEQNNIDMFDAEVNNYKPVVEQRNYALDDVVKEINENEDIALQMNDYVSSVPQSVKDRLISEPEILRGLNIDMIQGIGQQIMPEVIKQLSINPRQDFVRLYQEVGQRVLSKPSDSQDSKPKSVEPTVTREDKKKVAVNKKTPAPEKTIVDDYDAAWDDNKHFEAVRRRLQGF